jgi:hypothetical protein
MAGVVGVSTLVHTPAEPPMRVPPAVAEPAKPSTVPNLGTVRTTASTSTTTTMAPTASSLPVMREATTTTTVPAELAPSTTTTTTSTLPLVETTLPPGCQLDLDLPPVVDTCI